MFTTIFPNLRNNVFIKWMNKFLYSPIYIALVAILIVLSETFSLEIITYYVLLVTSVVIPSLLSYDMTPFIPGALMIHTSASQKTIDENPTVLLGDNIHHFIILISITSVCLIGRLVFDLIKFKERRHHYPRFLIGFAGLMVAFLLGGLFSETFSGKSVLFGGLETLGLTACYFYLVYTIDWRNFKKEYFAWVLLFFGLNVSAQVVILTIQGVDQLKVGWGMRNDMAGMIAMCIASAGYLAIRKKAYIGWLFSFAILGLFTASALSGSRGGSAATLAIAIASIVLVFIFAKSKITKFLTGALLGTYIVVFAILFIVMNDFMTNYFGRSAGLIMDYDIWKIGRVELWQKCLEAWTHSPVFGVGWYHEIWAEHVFPARCHDTYIQLLTCTGVFGVLAYLFHRFETVFVTFVKRPKLEKTFAFMCIIGLLGASIFDCHFFNIWPGLSYGFLLAFIEGRDWKHQMIEKETQNA